MEPTTIQTISIWKIIKDACKKICFQWKPLFFLTIPAVLLSVAVFIISILTYLKCVGASLESIMQQTAMSLIMYGSVELSASPQTAGQVGVFILIFAIALCMHAYIIGRLTSSVVRVLQSPEKKTIRSAFTEGGQNVRVLKVIGLLILAGIVITFSAMFFVIPGVFYTLGFSLALFYLILEQQGIRQALYASLNSTRGSKWKMLVLAIFTIVFSIVMGIVGAFVLQVLAKIVESSGLVTTSKIIVGLGMILLPLLIAVVQYLYTISILSQVYSEVKQFPARTTPARVWPIIVFTVLGFLIYVFMLVIVPSMTKNSITKAKVSAAKAYQMQKELEQKMKDEGITDSVPELTAYEKELQALFNEDIATIRPGNKGDGEVIGMGLNFKYPNDWISIGTDDAPKGTFMIFMRMSQVGTPTAEKAGDLFRGGVKFSYKYVTDYTDEDITGYEFLKKYATPKLEKEKKAGEISSFSITAYPGKKEVGVLQSEWPQVSRVDKKTTVQVRERYYYWFVGPHRYTIQAIDDSKDFAETDKATRVMINSLKFDDLISKYATEGK